MVIDMNYKGYRHLQWEDRLSLERMLKIKTPKPKIAEALGEIGRASCRERV